VTSLDWFTTVGLMPLGYAVAGPVADAIGLQETMIGAALITAALFCVALAAHDVRAVRQESMAG
jgi:DHA3 family tetracycline resistance protein-like MFS transporter